jgi:predicted phage terminase large subunit-like protein
MCGARVPRRRFILMAAWRKFLKFSGPRIQRGRNEHPANYARRTQSEWGLLEWVAHTCRQFNVDLLLIEGKASGIPAAQELANRYPDEKWSIHLMNPKGDKMARALASQPTFAQGMVFAPTPPGGSNANTALFTDWAECLIDEMAIFPKGKYDDQVDSVTQALNYLRSVGLGNADETIAAAEREAARRVPRIDRAIYPI